MYGKNPKVTSFDDFFEQFKTLDPREFHFLGWKPFRTFLAFTIDAMMELETQEGVAGSLPKLPPYTQAELQQFKERILPILNLDQPTLEELTLWSDIIQELRTYFDWEKIREITEIIFDDIDDIKRNSEEKDESIEEEIIEDGIIDGLKRGLPRENRQ